VPRGLPKVYDRTIRRYTIHEFKAGRYVEAINGNEQGAEQRCIELRTRTGDKENFFYRAA
jgi:hypothetical protein